MPVDRPGGVARHSGARALLLLFGVVALTGGCAEEKPAAVGDCDGFLGFENGIYETRNATVDGVAGGSRIGTGESLDCDQRPVESVGVYRIDGVSPATAIAVPDSSEAGRYVVWVSGGTGPRDWPEAIREGGPVGIEIAELDTSSGVPASIVEGAITRTRGCYRLAGRTAVFVAPAVLGPGDSADRIVELRDGSTVQLDENVALNASTISWEQLKTLLDGDAADFPCASRTASEDGIALIFGAA